MTNKRILLVEDDPDLGFLLTHVLSDAGYVVDLATTRREAGEYLEERQYALVIADWKLPDGDGVMIADAASGQGAKTIVMSGYLLQMPGSKADAHLTLMKPVRPDELVDAVRRAIGRRRTR